MDTLVERVYKQKTLIWDKVTSSLKIQWQDDEEGSKSRGGVDTNDQDEEALPNDGNNSNGNGRDSKKIDMNTSIAAVFLRDYECSRPCTLSPNIHSITPIQLEMYNIRFSPLHQFLVYAAIVTLFLGSFCEGQWNNDIPNFTFQILFTAFATAFFFLFQD